MKLLNDLKRVSDGLFINSISKSQTFESRKERQARVKAKRLKELEHSFMSVGVGYHEQQGWFK